MIPQAAVVKLLHLCTVFSCGSFGHRTILTVDKAVHKCCGKIHYSCREVRVVVTCREIKHCCIDVPGNGLQQKRQALQQRVPTRRSDSPPGRAKRNPPSEPQEVLQFCTPSELSALPWGDFYQGPKGLLIESGVVGLG